MTYAHALRVTEACDLVDFDHGSLHINRLKNGDSSVHYLEGGEIRSLHKLKRESPDSDFVHIRTPGAAHSQDCSSHRLPSGELTGIKFPVHPHMLRHYSERLPTGLQWREHTSNPELLGAL